MSENYNKEELTQKIYDKNLARLKSEGGMGELLAFNLENFAYRYLETTDSKDIKCQNESGDYWVESIEANILEALKWKDKELKGLLIELCKLYPGKESKNISLKLKLGTKIVSDNEVQCFASVSFDFPNFVDESKSLARSLNYTFDDPIELRNKHAILLEKLCEIFV